MDKMMDCIKKIFILYRKDYKEFGVRWTYNENHQKVPTRKEKFFFDFVIGDESNSAPLTRLQRYIKYNTTGNNDKTENYVLKEFNPNNLRNELEKEAVMELSIELRTMNIVCSIGIKRMEKDEKTKQLHNYPPIDFDKIMKKSERKQKENV